jgi:hypothetical protein
MTGSPINDTSQSQKRKPGYISNPDIGVIARVLIGKIDAADGGISFQVFYRKHVSGVQGIPRFGGDVIGRLVPTVCGVVVVRYEAGKKVAF